MTEVKKEVKTEVEENDKKEVEVVSFEEGTENLGVEELSKLVGRTVTIEEFAKHYANLKVHVDSAKVKELKDKVAAAKVIAQWMSDAGLDPTKINPFEAGSVLKALESKADVASAAVQVDKTKELEIVQDVKRTGSEASQMELAKIMLKNRKQFYSVPLWGLE